MSRQKRLTLWWQKSTSHRRTGKKRSPVQAISRVPLALVGDVAVSDKDPGQTPLRHKRMVTGNRQVRGAQTGETKCKKRDKAVYYVPQKESNPSQ